MITKIIIDKDGKTTKYILEDELEAVEEIKKSVLDVNDELKKAIKFFYEFKFPKIAFEDMFINDFIDKAEINPAKLKLLKETSQNKKFSKEKHLKQKENKERIIEIK